MRIITDNIFNSAMRNTQLIGSKPKPYNSVSFGKNQDSFVKTKPKVAVIDEFSKPTIDINSDGIKDVPHGRLVESIIKSIIDVDVIELTNNNNIKILTDFIPEQIKKIEDDDTIDAVNISAGLSKSLRIIATKVGIPNLTKDNIDQYREKIREYLLESKADNVYKVIESVEKLTEKGIPVYFAAGNKGAEFVNLFGVARGAINVGGNNANGAKFITSADNSMLRFNRGVYGVAKIFDKIGNLVGYNVSSTNKPEFAINEVSSGVPIVEKYVGKSIKKFLASDQDFSTKVNHDEHPFNFDIDNESFIKDKLFAVKGLSKRNGLSPEALDLLIKNNYNYATFDNKFYFTLDKDKKIKYDPDGSHRENLVGAIRGTSFASPTELANDLLKKSNINEENS